MADITSQEQLDRWVEGESIHRDNVICNVVDEAGNVVKQIQIEGGECCPDFSCCNPNLKWDKAMRLAFRDANQEDRGAMAIAGLAGLMEQEAPEAKVHIAGTSHQTKH